MEHTKKPFNVNDYCGKKTAIHCPSVEIAFTLITILEDEGYRRNFLSDASVEKMFSDDSESPCIAFVKESIYKGTRNQCIAAGYKVYEASEFAFSDTPEVSPELTNFLLSAMQKEGAL